MKEKMLPPSMSNFAELEELLTLLQRYQVHSYQCGDLCVTIEVKKEWKEVSIPEPEPHRVPDEPPKELSEEEKAFKKFLAENPKYGGYFD